MGALGVALSLLPLALIARLVAVGLGFMSMIALAGIARAAFTVYSQEIVRQRWRPAMSGATNMAVGLSAVAVSMGGGYVIQALGYPALFLAGASLTAAGALLFWAYFRVPRGELVRRSATGGAMRVE